MVRSQPSKLRNVGSIPTRGSMVENIPELTKTGSSSAKNPKGDFENRFLVRGITG